MKLSAPQFHQLDNKVITLLGMSGVGKTTLSQLLPCDNWFHYSGDYRIGTRYLNEPIMDEVKAQAMTNDLLRELLRSDSIYISSNITIDNLSPLSKFLGIVGDTAQNGIPVDEFKRRQNLFRVAEAAAMNDVPYFIKRARDVYGYAHFLNDAGGSICHLDDNQWRMLSEHSLILYLQADEEMEATLIQRAQKYPKPLYYDADFFDAHLAQFIQQYGLGNSSEIQPLEFTRWILPKLIAHRRPLYENIAQRYGYTICASKVTDLRDQQDFLALVEEAIKTAPCH